MSVEVGLLLWCWLFIIPKQKNKNFFHLLEQSIGQKTRSSWHVQNLSVHTYPTSHVPLPHKLTQTTCSVGILLCFVAYLPRKNKPTNKDKTTNIGKTKRITVRINENVKCNKKLVDLIGSRTRCSSWFLWYPFTTIGRTIYRPSGITVQTNSQPFR